MPTAILFAQEAAAKDQASPWGMFPFVVMGIAMLIFIWLPGRKQKKEQAAMLAAIKAGTKVVTSSGLIGTIVKIKDGEDEAILRSEDSKLKITRSSIVRVLGTDDEPK